MCYQSKLVTLDKGSVHLRAWVRTALYDRRAYDGLPGKDVAQEAGQSGAIKEQHERAALSKLTLVVCVLYLLYYSARIRMETILHSSTKARWHCILYTVYCAEKLTMKRKT